MKESSVFVSVREIATRWDISVATVRRMIWRKELPHLRLGSSVRVPLASIEEFESKMTTRMTTE